VIQTIVLDTSFIIDGIRNQDKDLAQLIELQKSRKAELAVPTIVIFEYYSGLNLKKQEVNLKTNELFSIFRVVDLTNVIARLAAQINRETNLLGRIGIADLLIGTTALIEKARLATKNTKDFKLIPGLKFWKR
jgi:predicted nucleic acid-binding protein